MKADTQGFTPKFRRATPMTKNNQPPYLICNHQARYSPSNHQAICNSENHQEISQPKNRHITLQGDHC